MLKHYFNHLCILGIDAADQAIQLSLYSHGNVRVCLYVDGTNTSTTELLRMIDLTFREATLTKKDLTAICICTGPGSFTSIKVSLASAEAIAFGLSVPLYGVDALTLMAATIPFYQGSVRVIKEAYRQEFYTATFDTSSGDTICKSEFSLATVESFYDSLQPNDCIVGSGLSHLLAEKDLNQKNVNYKVNALQGAYGPAIINYFLQYPPSTDHRPLMPTYIRPSDAELQSFKKKTISA